MDRIFCGDGVGNEYVVGGKYKELVFSKDLHTDFFTSFQENLQIKPEKKEAFWDVAYRIFFQLIIYIKTYQTLNPSQKIELLVLFRKFCTYVALFQLFLNTTS